MTQSLRLAPPFVIVALLCGCATGPQANPKDPLEPFNRSMYAFNEKADEIVLQPVARGYQAITPGFIRAGVSNFFSNLGEPLNAVNNLLQGKAGAAVSDVGRFAMNSVLGIFGLWDVATPAGLDRSNEDFGQTLGRWGARPGPYLVLPLLGPSSVRDAVGRIGDSPFGLTRYVDPADLRTGLYVLDIVNTRANLLGASNVLEAAALDRYGFVRDAYLQRRRSLVYDGKPPKDLDED